MQIELLIIIGIILVLFITASLVMTSVMLRVLSLIEEQEKEGEL